MRLWYLVTGIAALAIFGSWFAVTEHLAAVGVDVLFTRIGAAVIGLLPLVVVSAEETAIAVRAKRRELRLIRSRAFAAEAGQISVAIGPGEGALSNPQPTSCSAKPPQR